MAFETRIIWLHIELVVNQVVDKFNTMTHSVTDNNNNDAKTLVCTTLSLERFSNRVEFIQEIKRVIHEEVHQERAAAIDKQNKRLEEHINQRDHQLMQMLRGMQKKRKKKVSKRV